MTCLAGRRRRHGTRAGRQGPATTTCTGSPPRSGTLCRTLRGPAWQKRAPRVSSTSWSTCESGSTERCVMALSRKATCLRHSSSSPCDQRISGRERGIWRVPVSSKASRGAEAGAAVAGRSASTLVAVPVDSGMGSGDRSFIYAISCVHWLDREGTRHRRDSRLHCLCSRK